MPSQKISQFNVSTSLSSGDLFTFVVNGTNKTISYSNFKLDLGVTGTLAQVGNSLGVPVLNAVGSDYTIRNLESSKGILASVSAEDGITLANNFTQTGSGTKLIEDLTQDVYNLKTFVAGANIALTSNDNNITISFSGSGSASKTVAISSMSDFPAAVDGVRTLAINTDYLILADLVTSDRLLSVGSNTIRAASSQIVKVTYNGTGAFYTGNASDTVMRGFTISAPNGSVFDFSSSTSVGVLQFLEMSVEECDTIGTLNNMYIARISGVSWENIKTGGLVFSGNNINVTYDTCIVFLNGGIYIDLASATFGAISITKQSIQPSSAPASTFIKGAASSANISATGLGTVINNRTLGIITPLTGVSTEDARWNFLANDDIRDTRPDSLLSFLTPTTTTIAAINTPAIISGTWGVERASQMTATTGGRSTYNGVKSATLPIFGVANVEPVSGTGKKISIYAAKNGVVVAASRATTTISAALPQTMVLQWQDSFSNADYYEVFVENGTDAIDIKVNTANIRIN